MNRKYKNLLIWLSGYIFGALLGQTDFIISSKLGGQLWYPPITWYYNGSEWINYQIPITMFWVFLYSGLVFAVIIYILVADSEEK